jgi:serine phosphatase RsbU (regulator of sigma subunit)
MRTASEVGGDYYDYKIANDGEITIAIGDATGHGMRAGLMVSIIKSLFISHALKLGITEFFQEVTETIKQMKLNKLYMAMMLAKLKNGQLKISSAGMPPFYIYRYESKQVKEFVIKGMPLGAFDSFSYQTINTYLNPGDVLLLMSDGYPELFNDKDEILDNERIKDIFASCAEMPASEIVCQLFMAGDEWRNGKRLRDDITFVVCKMKPRKV